MNHSSNADLTPLAKTLRRNMTDAERKLWYEFLKHLPVMVHRQKVIGHYIADFYIHAAKLVIELDGEHHGEPEKMAKDKARDDWLRAQGLTVVRYSNQDVLRSFEGVCQDILTYLPNIPEPEIE